MPPCASTCFFQQPPPNLAAQLPPLSCSWLKARNGGEIYPFLAALFSGDVNCQDTVSIANGYFTPTFETPDASKLSWLEAFGCRFCIYPGKVCLLMDRSLQLAITFKKINNLRRSGLKRKHGNEEGMRKKRLKSLTLISHRETAPSPDQSYGAHSEGRPGCDEVEKSQI